MSSTSSNSSPKSLGRPPYFIGTVLPNLSYSTSEDNSVSEVCVGDIVVLDDDTLWMVASSNGILAKRVKIHKWQNGGLLRSKTKYPLISKLCLVHSIKSNITERDKLTLNSPVFSTIVAHLMGEEEEAPVATITSQSSQDIDFLVKKFATLNFSLQNKFPPSELCLKEILISETDCRNFPDLALQTVSQMIGHLETIGKSKEVEKFDFSRNDLQDIDLDNIFKLISAFSAPGQIKLIDLSWNLFTENAISKLTEMISIFKPIYLVLVGNPFSEPPCISKILTNENCETIIWLQFPEHPLWQGTIHPDLIDRIKSTHLLYFNKVEE